MRGTAIELRNRQGTGWTQRDPAELLQITYPTTDVQRALGGVSTAAQGRPLVFLGQRGRGKSHIMALLHHAVESPDKVRAWAQEWGAKPGFAPLSQLVFPKGFVAITETLSNQEYRTLWDLIFKRHPRGEHYSGQHVASGISIPAKSLMQDLFAERPTALILDEFQTWFDGLHDDSGDTRPETPPVGFQLRPDSVGTGQGTPRPPHADRVSPAIPQPRVTGRYTASAP